jgi:hypothetical protein
MSGDPYGRCPASAAFRRQMEDAVGVILPPVYDSHEYVAGHIPITVPKQVWTYHFGPTRLIDMLTFLEGKLVKIETGGYGH